MQRSLILLALCVGSYYGLIYLPLSRSVAELDEPLRKVWADLSRLVPATNGLTLEYFAGVESSLMAARKSSGALDDLRRVVEARIEPDEVTRARMSQPFQLIEFQDERLSRLEKLTRVAGQAGINLGAGVTTGFPQYLAETAYPELLWPQLQMAQSLVEGAIQAGVTSVVSVQQPTLQFHRGASTQDEWLMELITGVEVVGSGPSVEALLEMLPLRPAELRSRGLPETTSAKPVMFLRGVLLRKEGREAPDQVRLELTASSFVRVPRQRT